MDQLMNAIPGRLVVFLVGRSSLDLAASSEQEVRSVKSAPAYADVISRQRIVRLDRTTVLGEDISLQAKIIMADAVVIEATIDRHDILSDETRRLKRALTEQCRRMLSEFGCDEDAYEEYAVYCVSGYRGDPDLFLSLQGSRIASVLKDEDALLDEDEIALTLSAALKYGRDDLTIVEWDGAMLFDANGDFSANIELFEIASLQLLRSRLLLERLESRLTKTLSLLQVPKGLPFIKTRTVRKALKEVIEIRTQSLLESGAVEHNITLIGDWYSARLYALIAKKFHLDAWKTRIKEDLDALEDAYSMASENFSISYRATLEFIILIGWLVLLFLYVGEYFLVMP